MHGDLGNKLVLQAKRLSSLPPHTLAPYPSDLIHAILLETRDLDRDANNILASYPGTFNPSDDQATACALLVDHLSMRRNKRCLLGYHNVRAQRVMEGCWDGKDLLPTTTTTEAGGMNNNTGASNNPQHGEDLSQSNLSPEEQDLFRQYTDFLSMYKGQLTDIDLTGSLVPPRDLFVDVRVLKDAGEIQTEYGVLNLTKNSQLHVRLGDVERLIGLGFVERVR